MTKRKKSAKNGRLIKVALDDELSEAIGRALTAKGKGTFAGYLREAAIIRLAKEGYL